MKKRIYKLSAEDYEALASEIKCKLLSPCYFTGVVEALTASGEILRLTASLILYRRRVRGVAHYDEHDTIYAVSAVWWDLLCEDEEGVVLDDFDFDRLVEHLIEEE